MKKAVTIILLSAFYILNCSAQDSVKRTYTIKTNGFYIGVSGGYGFSAGRNTYDDSPNPYSVTSNTVIVKSYSFGKGINTGLYVGYMFNKNLGAELIGDYLMGYKFKYSWANDDSDGKVAMRGTMIKIIPAIKYIIGENKIHIYMKAGFILSIGTKVETYEKTTGMSSYVWSSDNNEFTFEYKGGLSYGFHGALGINYMFSKRIGAFAELAGYFQNWAPKKCAMTTFSVDGVDQLSTLPVNEKEIDYVKNYSTTYNNSVPQDTSQPSIGQKFYMPFSSIGFSIGLHILLNKKTEDK